jgi:hypothetical protein
MNQYNKCVLPKGMLYPQPIQNLLLVVAANRQGLPDTSSQVSVTTLIWATATMNDQWMRRNWPAGSSSS